MKICVVADIIAADTPQMTGQGVYSTTRGHFEPLFADFQKVAEKFDFCIGNFEAVLVDNMKSKGHGVSSLKVPCSILPVLQACNFRYMTVANNHSMEYGPDAFNWMCRQLTAAGIQPFGLKKEPCLRVAAARDGLTVGLFAFSTVPAMYGFDPEYYFVDATSAAAKVELWARLKEARAGCDHLLVFPHWGTEFMTRPAPWQIEWASQLIANGADAVLGAHPHCIQSAHRMANKPVYFSMGHLLADFPQEWIKRNLVLSVTLARDALEVENRIFSTDRNFKIYDTGERLAIQEGCTATETQEQYSAEANAMRKKVRAELLAHLARHPFRWMFNLVLWRWLIARAWYLLRNARKINASPDAVYAGPIH